MTFRTRLFLTSLVVASLTLFVATVLVSWSVRRATRERIERALVSQTRLAAETLSHRQAAAAGELDAEADAIAGLVGARVTFVSSEGAVLGDSDLTPEQLKTVENHADRPEIQQARREGLGIATRYSATIGTEMLYVAVPVRNPTVPELSTVTMLLSACAWGGIHIVETLAPSSPTVSVFATRPITTPLVSPLENFSD